jgi:multidrug resistance efflux pump
MARKKRTLRKNPSGLTIFLVVGAVASLAGGAWWFLKHQGSGGNGAKRRVGVDVKEAFANARNVGQNIKNMKGGGTLVALKADTARAEKARARRDRILAERAGSAETSEEPDLEGQRLDTSPPVG